MRVMAQPLGAGADMQPYTALLYRAVCDCGVDVIEYRTIGALVNPPDVIHLHWPEHVTSRRGLRKFTRAALRLATLSIARRRGAALVLTAHNVAPHDQSPAIFDRWFLKAVDRRVDMVFVLTEASRRIVLDARPGLAAARVVHTRHGHFRSVYSSPPDVGTARALFGIAADRPTLAFTGQIRRYKGVVDLIEAADGVDADLLIAGWCSEPQLRAELEAAAALDPQIHLHLGRLPPDELAAAVAAATVVVLPYRKVLNSGSVLLALSLDRPILVPETATFREIRDEVGEDWIRFFSGPCLGAADLRNALTTTVRGRPDLTLYEWDVIAQTTVGSYRRIRDKRRRGD